MPEGGWDEPAGSGRAGPGRSPIAPVLWIAAIALAAFVFYLARDLLLLLILSAALAYLLNPIVKIGESGLIKRETVVIAVYLAIAAVLVVGAAFLVPKLRAEAEAFSGNLPYFGARLDEAVDVLQREITTRYPAAGRFFPRREVRYERLDAFLERQAGDLPGLFSHLALVVLAAVLVPFFAYFFLRDSRKIIQLTLDRLPPSHIETSVAVWCEIDGIVRRYLRGLAVDVTAVAVVSAAGLWMIGVNYPLLLGAVSGLANVVPYLGPVVGGAASVLVATVQFKSVEPVAQVVTLYLCLKLLDFIVIQPLVIGRSQHLHPVLLIASIIVGGHALGIPGMIIAVPTVTIFQEIAKLLLERRRYAGARAAARSSGAPVQPYVC